MGKTFNKLVVILIAIMFLAGCTDATATAPVLSSEDPNRTNHDLVQVGTVGDYEVKQDNKTGCMYLEYVKGYQRGLSPYYDGKGKVAGCFASEGDVQAGSIPEIQEDVEEES